MYSFVPDTYMKFDFFANEWIIGNAISDYRLMYIPIEKYLGLEQSFDKCSVLLDLTDLSNAFLYAHIVWNIN